MTNLSKFPKSVRYNKNVSGTYNKVTNSSRYNGMVSSLKTHKTYNSVKEMNIAENGHRASPFRMVFGILFIFLLFICLYRATGNIGSGQPLTFTSFLHYLSTLNFGVVDFSTVNLSIVADWGIFNGLREFINVTLGIWNFGLTIVQLLINVVIFLFNIVKFIVIA